MTTIELFEEFLNYKEAKIEALTTWINEQGERAEDYMSHVDNINNYAELFEGENLHYGELDEEIQKHAKSILEDLDTYDILEFCNEPDIHYGCRRRYDEIWSISLGEIETQLTDIYDHKTKSNCIFTDLSKGLSKEEITQAQESSDYYVSNDYIYQDYSYDRVSITLDTKKFLDEYPLPMVE